MTLSDLQDHLEYIERLRDARERLLQLDRFQDDLIDYHVQLLHEAFPECPDPAASWGEFLDTTLLT